MQIDHQQDRQQCQHTGCTCNVPAGQPFCSEHCRIASSRKPAREEDRETCACGHSECLEHQ